MSATAFTTISSFQVIRFGKHHETVFHVIVNRVFFTFFPGIALIVHVCDYLKTNPLGPRPAVKLSIAVPFFEYRYTVPFPAKAFESAA